MKIKASGNALTGCATRLNYIERCIILFKNRKKGNKKNKTLKLRKDRRKKEETNYVVTSTFHLCNFLIDLW